jgi:two-component SAPR family response regulator
VAYLPAGLEAEFFVPDRYLAPNSVEDVNPPKSSVADEIEPAFETLPLRGLRVLLLEDNLIVALEAEDLLRTLGAAAVIAVSSLSHASDLLESNSFDFAVLDINLGFETSLAFADRLRRAKVPFVFASGYGDQNVVGASRIAELVVAKPYDRDSLNSAIALTMARLE